MAMSNALLKEKERGDGDGVCRKNENEGDKKRRCRRTCARVLLLPLAIAPLCTPLGWKALLNLSLCQGQGPRRSVDVELTKKSMEWSWQQIVTKTKHGGNVV
eukprot:scaffold39149_cov93-Skeletonema_marinoi.AAC.4